MAIVHKQDNFYGITPFCYLMSNSFARNSIHEFLKVEHYDISKKFFESVIEMDDVLNKILIKHDFSDLSDEDKKLITNRDVLKLLVDSYDKGFQTSMYLLRNIYKELALKHDVNFDITVGRISLNELLKMNASSVTNKLTAERLTIMDDIEGKKTDESIIANLRQYLSELETSAGVIIKRMELLDDNNHNDKKSFTNDFNNVRNSMVSINEWMRGYEKFNEINQELRMKNFEIKSILTELGFDMNTAIEETLDRNKKKFTNAKKQSTYLHLLPAYKTKLEAIEQEIRRVKVEITNIESGNELPLYYF